MHLLLNGNLPCRFYTEIYTEVPSQTTIEWIDYCSETCDTEFDS